jgi:hypothetical protein
MSNKFVMRSLFAAAGLFLAGPIYGAAFFSFSGNFTSDDDKAFFTFAISAPGTVSLQSWSYGGGVDPLSNVIAGGGFGPVLSLFDSGGNLLGFDRGGVVGGVPPNDCGAGGRSVDVVSGQCLDAYLQTPLGLSGTYTVVISEQDNTPNGPNLTDGFALDGTGNFTGGPFIDAGGFQRTSSYHFTVGPVENAVTVIPEPATGLLALAAIGIGTALRKRHQN